MIKLITVPNMTSTFLLTCLWKHLLLLLTHPMIKHQASRAKCKHMIEVVRVWTTMFYPSSITCIFLFPILTWLYRIEFYACPFLLSVHEQKGLMALLSLCSKPVGFTWQSSSIFSLKVLDWQAAVLQSLHS